METIDIMLIGLAFTALCSLIFLSIMVLVKECKDEIK